MTVIVNGRAYFEKGERVRLSPEGIRCLCPKGSVGGRQRKKNRVGTVRASNRGSSVGVIWDGNRPTSVDYLHQSFLERADIDGDVVTTAG